jgi:hypothetical protein
MEAKLALLTPQEAANLRWLLRQARQTAPALETGPWFDELLRGVEQLLIDHGLQNVRPAAGSADAWPFEGEYGGAHTPDPAPVPEGYEVGKDGALVPARWNGTPPHRRRGDHQ